MQAKLFLITNGLIVIVLVWRLISMRKGPRPTPLDLSSAKPTDFRTKTSVEPPGQAKPSAEKTLNCYFQFNGMMLDAFEVLGVPAGSSREACYRAYIDMRRRTKESTSVLDEAWRALESHFLSA